LRDDFGRSRCGGFPDTRAGVVDLNGERDIRTG
jgi:hypothetical protein